MEDNSPWCRFNDRIHKSNMLFQMVVPAFESVNCRWSYKALKIVMLMKSEIFELGGYLEISLKEVDE
jgi:hypothetical protein